jgi:serine/threonine protein kinase
MASGLVDIHGYGKVHRDIKPHNLKFDSENVVKILDFVAPIASTCTLVYRNARGA